MRLPWPMRPRGRCPLRTRVSTQARWAVGAVGDHLVQATHLRKSSHKYDDFLHYLQLRPGCLRYNLLRENH